MAADSDPQVSDKIEPSAPTKIPYWRLVCDQGVVTQEIIDHPYPGSGTDEDPFEVTWIPDDPRNPMNFSETKKWTLTMLVAIATLAVSLVSSAYTGGIQEIMMQFNIGQELATLGVSLFVLGFAVGPPFFRHWLLSSRNLLCMHTNAICFGIDRTIALGSIK